MFLKKGSEVGAHILSGAVIDPKGLDELIPDWRDRDCPLAQVPVTENHHWVLSEAKKRNLPHKLLPPMMSNKGCYTVSLGNLCRWLAGQAEALGVEIFPGFAAAEILFGEDGRVEGVATGDMGIARDGTHKPDYQPGMELRAKYTFFAEGVRGSLTKELKRIFALDANSSPQVYGIGLKELWDVEPSKHVPGRVVHTQGWPLNDAWGGGFIYHQADNQVAIGFVVALSYSNPHLSPFEEFQRWKQHPAIRPLLEGGRRVSYGARAINEGGWQSVPTLAFPGWRADRLRGGLPERAAGSRGRTPRSSRAHSPPRAHSRRSRRIARRTIRSPTTSLRWRRAGSQRELKQVRNVEPAVAKFGGTFGTLYAGAELWASSLRIPIPWTFRHTPDHTLLKRKDQAKRAGLPQARRG